MPTIQILYNDLCQLLGRQIPLEDLKEYILLIKGEVERVTPIEQRDMPLDYELSVEITSDRPDMLSTEGLVRALKGFLEIELGPPTYKIKETNIAVKVDETVSSVRPYIACAIIRGIEMSDPLIRQIMQLQEKLHTTHCRNRRKGSIGIHDLDNVEPPFTYYAEEPDKIKFIPLGETKEMTGREILQKHPKGVEYGKIIEKYDKYPLLVDKNNQVLSLPPIINGIVTQVTEKTKNLFIDVTGTDWRIVTTTLNIVASNIAERTGSIESVKIVYPGKEIKTPDFKPTEMTIKVSYANKILGLNLSPSQMIKCLQKARLEAKLLNSEEIRVKIPPYRVDFLHPIDLVEDIAVGYGYNKLEPELPPTITVGKELTKTKIIRKIRDLMVGLGFQEIFYYVMSSEDVQVRKMRLKNVNLVKIANPVSKEFSVMRHSLLPGLLNILSKNAHVELPHRIFEIGDVIVLDKLSETKTRNNTNLAALISDYSVGYEDIQAVLYAILRNLKIRFKIERTSHSSFIEGRTAKILVNNKEMGIVGEVHPEVLENFKIENPVAAFEISVQELTNQTLF
ncbi:MAG: phenylalanine--tRNA ligase subunit beta [Candidatus Baldrarchaeia archaeon]